MCLAGFVSFNDMNNCIYLVFFPTLILASCSMAPKRTATKSVNNRTDLKLSAFDPIKNDEGGKVRETEIYAKVTIQ